ncbi:hypothetical protein ACIBCT_21055 [Streptosporangium sp. NPDC050855]|uniref:hypothetical protein n=1 Tax=Streptosporangium sp. NPDC050855 TaxID=3366194 RepID=UPI0037994184
MTPEQWDADDKLRAAIEGFVRAFRLAPDHELVSEYVVSGVAVSGQDGREGETRMFVALPGGRGPHYVALGLLRQAQVFFEKDL